MQFQQYMQQQQQQEQQQQQQQQAQIRAQQAQLQAQLQAAAGPGPLSSSDQIAQSVTGNPHVWGGQDPHWRADPPITTPPPSGTRTRLFLHAPLHRGAPLSHTAPLHCPHLFRNEDSSAQAAVLTLKDVNTLKTYNTWPLHSWGSADAQAAQQPQGAQVFTPYNQLNNRVQDAVNGEAQSPAVLNDPGGPPVPSSLPPPPIHLLPTHPCARRAISPDSPSHCDTLLFHR